MSQASTFLASVRGQDLASLQAEVTKRDTLIRSLKFDLGFGTVAALANLRVAKRERAQLLTLMRQKRHMENGNESKDRKKNNA